MTVLRTLLAVLVAAAGLVLTVPAPAFACSCVMADAPKLVSWAHVVVVGEITAIAITPPPERQVMSSTDPATYTIAVDDVLKGTSSATLDVRSEMSGASCGLEGIEVGRRYAVLAGFNDTMGDRTDELWASLCGGTAPASGPAPDAAVMPGWAWGGGGAAALLGLGGLRVARRQASLGG